MLSEEEFVPEVGDRVIEIADGRIAPTHWEVLSIWEDASLGRVLSLGQVKSDGSVESVQAGLMSLRLMPPNFGNRWDHFYNHVRRALKS